jgi:hypothetical protein
MKNKFCRRFSDVFGEVVASFIEAVREDFTRGLGKHHKHNLDVFCELNNIDLEMINDMADITTQVVGPYLDKHLDVLFEKKGKMFYRLARNVAIMIVVRGVKLDG